MRTPTHILLCLFLLFCSCGKEDEENYHKFTQDDYAYIPTVYKQEGKVRNYINQHNDTIKIRSGSYRLEKKFYNTLANIWTHGNSGPSHYYDYLEVKIGFTDFKPTRYMSIVIFKNQSSLTFQNNIPGGGKLCWGSINQWAMPEDKQYLTELSINTTTYKDVMAFASEPKNQDDKGCYYLIADTVTPDKVYYSLKYGIIGFDDTKNNLSYRLKE